MKRLSPQLVLFLIVDFLIVAAIVIVVIMKKG